MPALFFTSFTLFTEKESKCVSVLDTLRETCFGLSECDGDGGVPTISAHATLGVLGSGGGADFSGEIVNRRRMPVERLLMSFSLILLFFLIGLFVFGMLLMLMLIFPRVLEM